MSEPSFGPHPVRSTDPIEWKEMTGAERPVALPQGVMLDKLGAIEAEILSMLKYPENWRTLDVTYNPPRVERVFTTVADLRVSLHCIHPCSREEALFHPHPWPSAMRLLSGRYEMAVGYGSGKETPPIAATLILHAGDTYEMANPDAWHYVRPVGEPVMTLMVTGTPWDRSTPRSSTELSPLTDARRDQIMDFFRKYYSSRG